MNIVVLDRSSVGEDVSVEPLRKYGNVTFHMTTRDEEAADRVKDADIIVVNKTPMNACTLEGASHLKLVCEFATGYDNVDTKAAEEMGIAVCHVPAYSTDAVAQHTFALILELTNRSGSYNASVQRGKWYESKDFTFIEEPLTLLSGKSLGIIGYGNIGSRVARIGEAFGMKINIYSRDKDAAQKSDFVTLHCPLTPENKGFIDKEFIAGMKDGAVLINTARGALVNESDLAEALKSGKLAAAALDVLSTEPPKAGHPLIGLPNCILTPHIAWMPKETRQKVIDICAANLESFLNGGRLNRIV